MLLAEARQECQHRHNLIDCIKSEAGKAEVSLAEIGTSQEELGQLLKNAYKYHAIEWLEEYRKESRNRACWPEQAKKFAALAGLTLEGIGTSEEELKMLGESK